MINLSRVLNSNDRVNQVLDANYTRITTSKSSNQFKDIYGELIEENGGVLLNESHMIALDKSDIDVAFGDDCLYLTDYHATYFVEMINNVVYYDTLFNESHHGHEGN